MKPPEFVSLVTVDREEITINPRYVIRVEPEVGNRARIFLEGRGSFVIDWSYDYARQQVCGLF